MTPNEAKFLDWAFMILGATLAFSGWCTIKKRRTLADGQKYEGKSAMRLGWLWVILGILLVAAVVFDNSILKGLGKLFLESTN